MTRAAPVRAPGRRTRAPARRRHRADRLAFGPPGFPHPGSSRARGRAGGPEIAASEEAIGEHLAKGMEKANQNTPLTRGLWYAGQYRLECHLRGLPDLWKETYWDGHADPDYWERIGKMRWRLRPGVSASEGIRRWLAGLTIAECVSTIRALESDAVRAAVGDAKFDERYGSAGREIPAGGSALGSTSPTCRPTS